MKTKTDRQVNMAARQLCPSLIMLLIMLSVVSGLTSDLYAQGSIFGQLTNEDLSVPANNQIVFFGFVINTDDEIRLSSSIGAGYDAGNWFDDFQNYASASAGQPYHFFFFNPTQNQHILLNKIIPSNSFQQEDISLSAGSWPQKPSGINSIRVAGDIKISWSMVQGLSWHIYRRVSSSSGSFFRLDNIAGDRSDRGEADSFFVDTTTLPGELYEYVIIAEDVFGSYSPPSDITLLNPTGCCQGMTGNANNDPKNEVTVSDISVIIDFLFVSGTPIPCPEAAHTDGDQSGDASVSDISWIIDHLFGSGQPLAPCP